MTDARTTQIVTEQWADGAPRGQVTQIAMEHWAVGGTPVEGVLTQIAIEQWARVTPPPIKGGFNMPMQGM